MTVFRYRALRGAEWIVIRCFLCGNEPESIIGGFGTAYRLFYPTETRAYSFAPDPFKVEWVDLNSIERFSGLSDRGRRSDFGTVKEGKWDRGSPSEWSETDRLRWAVADTIEETTLYGSMCSHFLNGVPWEETELLSVLRENLHRYGHAFHGCRNDGELFERFDNLDRLYERIERDGYKTQHRLAKEDGTTQGWGFIDRYAHEIIVDLGREGELLFVDGRHRLCIAKLLELDSVPVTFRIRHEQWMKDRSNLVEKRLDHPDLWEHYLSVA